MKKLRAFIEGNLFSNFILGVIILNCILMGLQTSVPVMNKCGNIINLLDKICFYIFVAELLFKIVVYNKDFVKDGWNIFDFIIVLTSFLSDFSVLSTLRILRVFKAFKSLKSLKSLKALKSLRSLKLLSGLKQLQIIVAALGKSIPSIAWTALLLLLVYYIFGLVGTTIFRDAFPQWFGTLGKTIYTLFQVMTLESWSMGISRPVMEVFPMAWLYFVPFVIISSFVIMNVVVGIVVNAISEVTVANAKEVADDKKELMDELENLKANLNHLEELLKNQK